MSETTKDKIESLQDFIYDLQDQVDMIENQLEERKVEAYGAKKTVEYIDWKRRAEFAVKRKKREVSRAQQELAELKKQEKQMIRKERNDILIEILRELVGESDFKKACEEANSAI